eukprot:g23971.t1
MSPRNHRQSTSAAVFARGSDFLVVHRLRYHKSVGIGRREFVVAVVKEPPRFLVELAAGVLVLGHVQLPAVQRPLTLRRLCDPGGAAL